MNFQKEFIFLCLFELFLKDFTKNLKRLYIVGLLRRRLAKTEGVQSQGEAGR